MWTQNLPDLPPKKSLGCSRLFFSIAAWSSISWRRRNCMWRVCVSVFSLSAEPIPRISGRQNGEYFSSWKRSENRVTLYFLSLWGDHHHLHHHRRRRNRSRIEVHFPSLLHEKSLFPGPMCLDPFEMRSIPSGSLKAIFRALQSFHLLNYKHYHLPKFWKKHFRRVLLLNNISRHGLWYPGES